MGKYTNFGIKYPVFSLGRRAVTVGGGDGARECLVNVGGGGSARSGIKNCVAVFSIKHVDGKPTVVDEAVFESDERLCTTVETSHDQKLFVASTSDGALLLEFDSKEKTLKELLFWKTDSVVDKDTPACQNVACFSPVDSSVVLTGGDDGSACLWKVEMVEQAPTKDTEEKEEKGIELQQNENKDGAEKKEETAAKSKEEEEEDDDDTDTEPMGETQWKSTATTKLKGHTKPIKDIDFHPSGKIVATASGDNTVRLWDVETGKPLQVLPSDAAAGMNYRRCRFASEDRLITLQAKQGRGGYSFLVEFTRDTETEEWQVSRAVNILKGLVTTIKLHPPFISIGDARGGLSLLDFDTLEKLSYFPEVHNLPVTGLSSVPNPDDRSKTYIVTASMDKTVTMLPARRPRFRGVVKLIIPFLLILLVILFRIFFLGHDGTIEDNTSHHEEL